MSAKTKKPVEISETSTLSYILGLTSAASMGRITMVNLASLLKPLVMKPETVSSLAATDQTGIYRLSGSVKETLPDGASLAYGLVITFNLTDIYKIVFSYLGSVAFYFYNATSKMASYTMLGTYKDKTTIS